MVWLVAMMELIDPEMGSDSEVETLEGVETLVTPHCASQLPWRYKQNFRCPTTTFMIIARIIILFAKRNTPFS